MSANQSHLTVVGNAIGIHNRLEAECELVGLEVRWWLLVLRRQGLHHRCDLKSAEKEGGKDVATAQ